VDKRLTDNGRKRKNKAKLPALREILEKELPVNEGDGTEDYPLIDMLPSAFSYSYIRNLLESDGIREFHLADRDSQKIIDWVVRYCASVQQPERDRVCQRLEILSAFCSYWLYKGSGWSQLSRATWEPVCLNYEKPTDVYLLRVRAAVTDFTKRHRALADLKRLIELDPENLELYQAEIKKWQDRETHWRGGLDNQLK